MAVRGRLIFGAALGSLALMAGAAIAGGGVQNGYFETGNLDGWQTAGVPDTWTAYSDPIPPPPENRAVPRGGAGPGGSADLLEPVQGDWAAGVSSTGPGTRILLQTIRLPGGPSKLEFLIAHGTEAGRYYTPKSLSFRRGANEQFRVDLMRPKAKPKSMANRDILLKLFRTHPDDSLARDWFRVHKWIPKDLRGRRVTLRFAEVDNQAEMMAAVDAVELLQPVTGRAN